MSEDAPKTAGDEAAPTTPASIAMPDVFVKGGTTSSLHDQMLARSIFEAEERRRAADKERELLADGGQEYTNKLSPHGGLPQAYVLLDFVTSRGEPIYDHGVPVQCLADILLADPSKPEELTLVLVCPRCIQRMPRGSQQFAQLQIRQSNRGWHLDRSTAGELIMFEGKGYRSAGRVMESERFSCGQCGWAARIDKNKVWAE